MANLVPSGRPGTLANLALMAGPRYGEELPVPAPTVVLGRAAGCDVVIDDDSVSAQHARLEFDTGAWRITDLGSTNGTAVEGVKLAPQLPTPLPYGSTVRLGGVQLQFREAEAAVDLEAARAEYVAPEKPRTLREERSGPRVPLWLLLVLLVIAVAVGILVYLNVAAPTAVGAVTTGLPVLAMAFP